MNTETIKKARDFDQIIFEVKRLFTALRRSQAYKVGTLPKEMPEKGIYMFSKNGKTLYVGRTNHLQQRLQNHTRNNHYQATLAFLMARRKTKNIKATYRAKGSRTDLLRKKPFGDVFDAARSRIKQMDVRFVGVEDPVEQAVLEIYAAVRTNAVFNDFDNH